MDKDKISEDVKKSKLATSSKEVNLLNAISKSNNSEDTERYQEILGRMILPEQNIEKQKETGKLRYQYSTNKIDEEKWINHLRGVDEKTVNSFIEKYDKNKDSPSDSSMAELGVSDVTMMRKNPEPYELALAATAYVLSNKKDNFSFVDHINLWEPTFKTNNSRLEELYSRDYSIIKEVLNSDPEKSEKIKRPDSLEYKKSNNIEENMFMDNTFSIMELGLRTKVSIMLTSNAGFNKGIKNKMGGSIINMSQDYEIAIGENEISSQGLNIGKSLQKRHDGYTPSP